MGEERKLAHVERIPIRWGDMDGMNHVNNTVYFRFMEQARIGWFDSVLPDRGAWKAASLMIVNAACNFRRAMSYPGTVEVRLYVDRLGGSSIATSYEMRVDDDPAPYADGTATIVVVDRQTQKPMRIPDSIRSKLQ